MTRTAIDDLGQRFDLTAAPRRIVSLVPSLTELVCSLGAAARLVAVTRYCTDPAHIVAALPKVGGTKNPDLERIAALSPDLILVNSEENRRADYDRLRALGLRVFVSFPVTIADAAVAVERVGALLGHETSAAVLATAIRTTAVAPATSPLARMRVFCPIWRKPWMSFNRNTYADDVLRAAGGDNVCAGRGERYPSVDLAEIATLDPEVILLPDEPYPFAARHRAALNQLRATSAWRRQRVFLVDGKALTWYGPRTPAALRYFHRILIGP